MKHTLSRLSISAAFLLISACSSTPDEPPVTEDDFNAFIGIASGISLSQGCDMIGACKNSETFKAAIVSYSKSQEAYVLQLISGQKGDGKIVNNTDTTAELMLQKANHHCFAPR